MTDRKAVIKNADMSDDMQQDAIDCATQVPARSPPRFPRHARAAGDMLSPRWRSPLPLITRAALRICLLPSLSPRASPPRRVCAGVSRNCARAPKLGLRPLDISRARERSPCRGDARDGRDVARAMCLCGIRGQSAALCLPPAAWGVALKVAPPNAPPRRLSRSTTSRRTLLLTSRRSSTRSTTLLGTASWAATSVSPRATRGAEIASRLIARPLRGSDAGRVGGICRGIRAGAMLDVAGCLLVPRLAAGGGVLGVLSLTLPL